MEEFNESEFLEYGERTKKNFSEPSATTGRLDFDETEFNKYAENVKPIEDPETVGKKIGNSFGEYLGKKYTDGKAVLFQGTYGDAVINGEMTYEEAKEAYNVKALEGSLKYEDVGEIGWRDNFVQRGLGETAQATPYLVENTKRGAIGAVLGAGALFAGSLALNFIGIGAAIPDEIVTGGNLIRTLGLEVGKKYTAKQVALIAGSTIGSTVATAPHIFKVERGNAYMGFREVGLSHEGSVKGANTYGAAAATLELMKWKILAAPFKQAILKQGGDKAIRSIVGETAKEYFLTIGKETGLELGQEGIELITQALLAAAEHNPNAAVSKDDFLQAFQQTLLSTVAATSVFGAAGAAVNYKTFKAEMKKNLDIQLAEKEEMKKDVSAAIIAPEEAEVMAKTADGEAKVETVEAPTKTEMPSLKPEERAIVNKRVKELSNKVKKADKEVAKLEKEFTQLEAEGKSTTAIENKINKLIDEKDMAQAEINDVKSGKKSVADITGEQIKVTPDKTLQMRKEQIKTDITNIKQDIKDAEASLKVAKMGNKNTAKILEKIVSLNEKLDGLTNEKALIESGGLESNDYRLPEAPDKGQVSLQRYRKQQVQELQNGITNYIRGAKAGAKQQKIETKEIHSTVEGMLREAGIRINERGPFVNILKNIQNMEDLAKNQSKIIDKVNEVIENRNKKAAIKQLGKFKKSIKKANITAETRSRAEYLLGLTKMNDFDSGLRQREIEQKAKDENRLLTDAEIQMLADLQVASGFRDVNGRFVRSAKDLNELNAEIANLLATGRTLRQEQLQKVKQEKINNINEAIDKISTTKFNQNKFLKLAQQFYGNWGFYLEMLGGKDFSEKFDPEHSQGKMNRAISIRMKALKEKASEIYKADRFQLQKVFKGMSKNNYSIILKTESDIKHVPRQISKMEIIDIYNSIKNEQIAEDYFNAYGSEQIFSLLENLTEQDMKLADHMQEIVQGGYDIANAYYKKKTGKTLTKRANYWMASSDYMNEEYNALDSYRPIASVPSYLKEKVRGTTPVPHNAMSKMKKHVSQTEYINHLEQAYVNLRDIFSDKNVRNLVNQRIGEDTLRIIDNELDDISLVGKEYQRNIVERWFENMTGKWAVAKIADPYVGLKQLTQMANYGAYMPKVDFAKYVTKGLLNAPETFKYMFKNSEYVRERYAEGYDEAMALAEKMGETAWVSTQIIKDIGLFGTKAMDIVSIVLGGNAYVQHELSKNGGNLDAAIDAFERLSEKTQQSNNSTSLSQLQKGRVLHFFMKFRNTLNQYARLITSIQIEYMRGEIGFADYASRMGNFAIVQPVLYTYLGAALKDMGVQLVSLFDDSDEEKKKEVASLETFLDAMNGIVEGIVGVVPLLDDVVDHVLRGSENILAKKMGIKVDMPEYKWFESQMLADLGRGFAAVGTQIKHAAEDKPVNLLKLIEGIGYAQEPFTAIPVKAPFDMFDLLSGGEVKKAMDTKKKKGYTKKKSSGLAKRGGSGLAKRGGSGLAKRGGSGLAKR